MALTPEDVVNQKFTITKFRDGYDLDQVDDFLDTIVEELRQHEQEKKELRAKIAELEEQLEVAESQQSMPAEAAPRSEEAASERTIVVDAPQTPPAPRDAEPARTGSTHEADAKKSSAMLQLALELHDKYVRDGEETRDRLIGEGEEASRKLVEEAQVRRKDELRLLDTERKAMQGKIKDLRDFESEYRTTLGSYIRSQLRALDGSPEPEGAPEGLG